MAANVRPTIRLARIPIHIFKICEWYTLPLRLTRDCFYQLCQLRAVARSLSTIAAATLVHSFVTNRLAYYLSLYAGLPSVRLVCFHRIQTSAARLIGQIPKFGYVTGYMLEGLRWLPVRQRIEYRVASLVWRCQLGIAPI